MCLRVMSSKEPVSEKPRGIGLNKSASQKIAHWWRELGVTTSDRIVLEAKM
jgi:hypothetical protein